MRVVKIAPIHTISVHLNRLTDPVNCSDTEVELEGAVIVVVTGESVGVTLVGGKMVNVLEPMTTVVNPLIAMVVPLITAWEGLTENVMSSIVAGSGFVGTLDIPERPRVTVAEPILRVLGVDIVLEV